MKNRLSFSLYNKIIYILLFLIIIACFSCGGGGGGGEGNMTNSDITLDIGEVKALDISKVVIYQDTSQLIVNNQVLITFKDSISEDVIKEKIMSIKGEIVGYIKDMNDYQILLKEDHTQQELNTLLDQLNNDPDIEAASLNIIHEIDKVPDPGNDQQWFDGIDWDWTIWDEEDPRGRNWGLEAIYALSAWDYNNSMLPIKIGVIDGGFRTDHEDLVFKSASGSSNRCYAELEDFVDRPARCNGRYPSETREEQMIGINNHGTHVAGIIGAQSNNENGITGIIWKNEMYAWKTDFQHFDIKYGIVWLLSQGVKVINLSLGNSPKRLLCRAPLDGGTLEIDTLDERNYIETERRYWTSFMQRLANKYDFLIVQAAGNEGIDAKWNGLFSSINDNNLMKRIIIVGAIDYTPRPVILGFPTPFTYPHYRKASFSNFGPKVDLFAPGVDIYSTIYESPFYKNMPGTSMAAPIVTGTAGLVWGVNPDLTAAQVKEILTGTADRPIIYEGHKCKILNAKVSVEKAMSAQATEPIQELPSGFLIGKVIDAITGDGIEEAFVSVFKGDGYNIYTASSVSNFDGSYELILEPGSYKIFISKDAYISIFSYKTIIEGVKTYDAMLRAVSSENQGDGEIGGQIANAFTGKGVSNLTIDFRQGIDSVNGDVVGTTITDDTGCYSIILPSGNYTGEINGNGYSTGYILTVSIGGQSTGDQNGSVTPIMPEGQTRIILTWGITPSDLDSHLTGPLTNDTRFHIYYTYAESCPDWVDCEGSPWADYVKLDIDDIYSYGPETITIYQQTDGIYRYSVHDFTNKESLYSKALSNSGAQVKVYRGSKLIANFNVPSNQEGTIWTIFELNGNTISPINIMSYESKPVSIQRVFRTRSFTTDTKLFKNLPPK